MPQQHPQLRVGTRGHKWYQKHSVHQKITPLDQVNKVHTAIANIDTNSYTVTVTTALPHNLNVNEDVNIKNVIEAKVKPKDSTETELRKIDIFKNLNRSKNYGILFVIIFK